MLKEIEVIAVIRFALCDDEAVLRNDLADRLSAYMDEKGLPCDIRQFADGRTLLAQGQAADVLFLDIQMDGPDGLETARRLRTQGFCGLLIFMTVLQERVFDAFAVQAFDYLVKPVEEARLWGTVDRALDTLAREEGKRLLVQRGSDSLVLLFSQIVCCEVVGRKLFLRRQGGGTVDYYHGLESLEQCLDSRFFRCHRSYLINLDYVRGCGGGQVTLSEGPAVPVSRLRERALTEALLAHMKERRR